MNLRSLCSAQSECNALKHKVPRFIYSFLVCVFVLLLLNSCDVVLHLFMYVCLFEFRLSNALTWRLSVWYVVLWINNTIITNIFPNLNNIFSTIQSSNLRFFCPNSDGPILQFW